MSLAYVMTTERGAADLALAEAARLARAGGLVLAGIVQVNTERPGQGGCDMDVRVLPDGPVIRISQSLGREARGCRLDPGALEAAVAATGRRLGVADAVIINKFGKHEAEGRGFRETIGAALSLGLPVVVGLNGLNLAAFEAFAGGLAARLPEEPGAIADWLAARCRVASGGQTAAAERAAWS
jgi:hypothetical protein